MPDRDEIMSKGCKAGECCSKIASYNLWMLCEGLETELRSKKVTKWPGVRDAIATKKWKFRHKISLAYFLTGTYSDSGAVHVEKHNSVKRRRWSCSAVIHWSAECEANWKRRRLGLQSVKALTKGSHFFLFRLHSSKNFDQGLPFFSFSSPFFQIGCTFFWIDWMYWISLDWSWPDIWFIANISYFYSFSSVLSSIRCRLFKVLVEAAISITPRSGPFKTHCTFKENISSVGVLRRQCFTEQS